MMEEKKFVKIIALAIFFVLIFATAVQAIVKPNIIFKNENQLNDELLKDNILNRGIWEDFFDNESKIDPSPPGAGASDNYIVSDGVVSMINTVPCWTDISWTKMRPITLNIGASETDYALKLNIIYDPDMQSDYEDIRFKHENNPSLWLDYWIEWYNNNYAIIWVKIPLIPAGSSVLYIFYGNPSATSESNFDDVFNWEDIWTGDEQITYHLDSEGTWDPDVSFGNNDFLVCWEEGQAYYPPYTWGFKQEIRASVYDKNGNILINDDEIFNDGTTYYRNENPSAAFGNGKCFVAWENYDTVANPNPATLDIKARTVRRSGDDLILGSVIDVCSATSVQADANVEFDSVNNQFCVVWEDGRLGTTNYNLYGRLYDTSGNPVGGEKTISSASNNQAEPWIAYDPFNSQYLITWEEGVAPDVGPFDIYVGLFDEDLNLIGPGSGPSPVKIADGTSDIDYNFPCVSFCEETKRYLVTYNDGDISDSDWWGNVWGLILDDSGNIVVPTFQISAGEYIRTDIVPYLDTLFFVSYDDNSEIRGKLISSNGETISGEIQLSSSGSDISDWANIGVGNDRIFVAWEDDRINYPFPWNDMPDVFGDIWTLDFPTNSVIYLLGTEQDPVLLAHVTSIEILPGELGLWDLFNAVHDSVVFSILDGSSGSVIISDISPGSSLQSVVADSIRLKATFARNNPSYSPYIDYWSASWLENNPPNTPQQPSGPTIGETGTMYTYSTSTTDPEGHDIYYWFDWDDSTNSGWVGPYYSGETCSISKSWTNPGTYDIKVKAKDIHDEESAWSPILTVIISIPNDPPYTPSNPNPYNGEINVDVDHDLGWNGGDPNSGDTVSYDVYFGDTSPPPYIDTIGPYPGSQTSLSYQLSTMNPNTQYFWKIVAEDSHGEISTSPEWSFTTENNPPYSPSNPDPYDGETGVDINADLSWVGGDPDPGDNVTYDVYFEANDPTPDVLVSDDQIQTTYDPGTMSYGTTYYWQIIAMDSHGATTIGSIWDFTTGANNPPYNPSNPDPYNGEINVDVDHDLSWNSGDPNSGDTVEYDIYFGNTSSPQYIDTIGPFPGSQTSINYDPGTMQDETIYYWQIIAWDNHGAQAIGPIWSFTTESLPNNPPYTPYDPNPSNHQTNVNVNSDISWSGGDPDPFDTVTYDVYFDTTSPPSLVFSNQSSLIYDPGTLNYGTKYYWKIVAWDNHGAWAASPIWDFTTENDPPYTPSNPDPYDGETDVELDHDLSWIGGDPNPGDTVTYDVYFGDTSPPPQVSWGQDYTFYDPGTMDGHTNYYWQIISMDNHGATTNGPEWSFTTENRDPNQPTNPDPYDGETNVDVDHDLSWACTDPDGDTLVYDIYLDDFAPPTTKREDDWPNMVWDPGTMMGETVYYWMIVAQDNYGGSTEGVVWQFTTEYVENNPPYEPSNPIPNNGATDVDINSNISWTGGDPDGDIVTYDIYFGNMSPPPKIASNHPETTYDLDTMNYNSIYYWKIVAIDSEGATTNGPEWSFTTEDDGGNNAPDKPDIDGPNIIIAGDSYDFSFVGSDPDGDNIKYIIDWEDGFVEETDFVSSGTSVQLSHTWDPDLPIFPYQITCKTEDIHGSQSITATHFVIVIKSDNLVQSPKISTINDNFMPSNI